MSQAATRDADSTDETSAEDIEVTAADEQVAYEILKRPPPWSCSPLQHVSRIVARYRVRLERARMGPVAGADRKPS